MKKQKRDARRANADARVVRGRFPALREYDAMEDEAERCFLKSFQEPVVVVSSKGEARTQKKQRRESLFPKKSLIRSSSDEIDALAKYRENVLMQRRIKARLTNLQMDASDDKDRMIKDPLERALKRLRKVAEEALESSRYGLDLRGFEGEALSPHEFRVQLRSQFNVKLDDEELVAVVDYFDKNKDGRIDVREIIHKFLHPEKLQVLKHQTTRKSHIELLRIAMGKIRTACQKKGFASPMELRRVFDSLDEKGDGRLSRDEFVSSMRERLGVELYPFELEAVYIQFDPDANGTIDYGEFTFAYFNRRSFEAKLRRRQLARTKPPFRPTNPFHAREAISTRHFTD